jgi:hypothetical protein
MNLVGFGTPKNCPGQTPPASQISAHLINYSHIYALLHYFVFFYESGSYFWDASGVGQERDGHVVSGEKMMYINSSFIVYNFIHLFFLGGKNLQTVALKR